MPAMARKEDTMVPDITETACRITGLRYQELLAEADWQRRAASVPAGRVRAIETVQHHMGAAMVQVRHLLQGVRTQESTDPTVAPGPLAVH
jgi:hypothetical protein